MADTYLVLGGFVFTDPFSVPERINGGGRQRVVVHKFIGGNRVVDALGPDDDVIRWRGRFRGAAAVTSAEMLDVMRRSGKAVLLSYWTFAYQVVVTRFTWSFERFYEVTYEIECTIVQDLQAPAWAAVANTLDSLFGADTSLADAIGVGVAAIDNALAEVLTARAAVAGLNNATASSVAGVMGAVTSAIAAAATASVAADGISGAMGGVVAGGDPAAMGTDLVAQGAQFQTAAAGVQTGGVFARMATNLGSI